MDGTKKKYRANLPLPEDTTLTGGPTLVTPGFLRFVGELLFGERWQTPLAQWLGEARGKPLAPATVHRWSLERRSIPAWVCDALAEILETGRQDLDQRAKLAGELAARIRNPLAQDDSASLGWAKKERGRNGRRSIH